MENVFLRTIEELIADATGEPACVQRRSTAGGGCISQAQVLDLEDGRRFFVKSNPRPLPFMFEREAEALRCLGEAGPLRVPRVIGVGGGEGSACPPFIVLEYVASGRPQHNFFEEFGRGLALLHQRTRQDRFGFDHDNYIGSTPQPNGWCNDWVTFWRERRLGPQLERVRRNGLADAGFLRLGDVLMDRLDRLISQPDEPACLLHGDLWGGNYLCDAEGRAVLIDPAAYCGRREADLAMTLLFGGFDDRFHQAYCEVWPLADGADARLVIYKLYHLVNHLNLFGSGYYDSCLAILRRFAR